LYKFNLKLLIAFFALSFSVFAKNINIDNIVTQAKKENKHLFILLHKKDCGYCESMITFTLDDDKVKDLIKKKFIYIDINISDDDIVTYEDFKGSGHDFAIYVGYNFYPSSLFIGDHEEIAYAVAGYQEEKRFLNILKYVDTASYKTMNLEEFESKYKLKR
jgi:thioredoxin-related protein